MREGPDTFIIQSAARLTWRGYVRAHRCVDKQAQAEMMWCSNVLLGNVFLMMTIDPSWVFATQMDRAKVCLREDYGVERTQRERTVILFVGEKSWMKRQDKKKTEYKGKGKLYRSSFTPPALHPAMISNPSRAITLWVATVHFKACCCPWQLSLVLWIVSYLCLCNWILGFLWLFTMEGISLRALHTIGCHK